MKKLHLLIIVVGILFAGCKKEKTSAQSIIGKWELRNILGVQVAGAPSKFAAGNGMIVEFSASEYQRAENGNVLFKQNYTIVNEQATIDGETYNKAFVSDNSTLKWYFKISGNKLIMSVGSIAHDGFTETYEKL